MILLPKEEAVELVSKMCLNDCTDKNIEIAKQCALIAVEFAQERVNDVADHIFSDSTDATNDEWDYLEEVKKEIELL